MQCPCNTTKQYSDCCEKAHLNIKSVLTAEALMRSRYSAFVLANINYLHESHHSTTRPSNKERKEILQWTKSVQWLKLEIINIKEDISNNLTGKVEFKAFFLENGKVDIIHENSSFCKENNHWVYF